MATGSTVRSSLDSGSPYVVLRDVGWKGYNAVLKLRGERPRPRVVYLDGSVYFMTTSLPHERFKKLLGLLVVAVAQELRISFYQTGSTTFRRKAKRGGVEGDETYYFANAARVRGKKEIDLKVDPPPDLAIEVVHTNPVRASLEVYRRLGVPEVWACEDDGLMILVLQADGKYVGSKTSKVFPFLTAAEIFARITQPDPNNDLEWLDELQRWAREDVAKRPRPAAGP
ncbi:MAG: Uma2 family endonuclease [Isosphaeraceae bacterium]|nr:Uma2 family endonuclease [Isosphaeraceae bacterium]